MATSLPITAPPLTAGPYTIRDVRTVSRADRIAAVNCLLEELVYTHPQETALWDRSLESLIIWAMDARGGKVRADYEARRAQRLPVSEVLGDFLPAVFAVYTGIVLTNAFAWYGFRALPRQGASRPFRAWPMSGFTTPATMIAKVRAYFDVIEAYFAFDIPDGAGGNFRLQQAAVWYYDDQTRDSVGDRWSRVYFAELTARSTRASRPLQFSQIPNDGFPGRVLHLISPGV